MNRIIIIGNGFDLAHGLPTSYSDFICWYWNQRVNQLRVNQTKIDDDGLCSFSIKDKVGYCNWANLCLNAFPRFINPIPNDEIIKSILTDKDEFEVNYSSLFGAIFRCFLTKTWVDIENEYYKLLCPQQININKVIQPQKLNEELDNLKSKLITHLSSINECITDSLFIKDIQDIILGPIKKDDIAVENYKVLVETRNVRAINDRQTDGISESKQVVRPDRILLLNFNYTKTAELYCKDSGRLILNYIHGNLSDSNNIIFGYGDELDDKYKLLQELNDNEYLRNVKSVRYLETDNYRKMLEFIEFAPFQIYIMGHSCGNSDRTLLNRLFEHKNCVSIKPFYHQYEKDGKMMDNYLDIVQNISRNFKDMNLMRDRVVNKMYCESLPQKL